MEHQHRATPSTSAPDYMPFEDFEAATLAALEEDLAPIRSEHPDVTLTATGGPRQPGRKAHRGVQAGLFDRGRQPRHGGFAGLLLGSVGEQVVRHSACPVLVDKASRDSGETSGQEQMEEALASELKLD